MSSVLKFWVFTSIILFLVTDSNAQNKQVFLKWYLKPGKLNSSYTVTINAVKDGRYMEFGKLRFSVAYKDMKGWVVRTDTLNFFDTTKEKDVYSALGIVPGGKAVTKSFKTIPGTRPVGIRLFYQWHDTSYSSAPDPVEDKVIVYEYIFGESSVGITTIGK